MTRRLLGLLLPLAGCAHQLSRPSGPPCAGADPAIWAARAGASVVVAPFRSGKLYDVEGLSLPVRVETVPGARTATAIAVLSFPSPLIYPGWPDGFERLAGRSFIYDDALYALERTMRGDRAHAQAVLETLARLQRPDGAWGFSFRTDGDGFYNAGYIRAGAVAFVVYAFARYRQRWGDPRFEAVAARGADWLLAQRDPREGLIRAGFGRWLDHDTRFDPGFVAGFAVTEHQIDAYFALKAMGGRWSAAATQLAAQIHAVLWLEQEGRYAVAWTEHGLDHRSALDASGTWGALFLLAVGRGEAAQRALAWVDRRHRIEVAGWNALDPWAGEPPATWFVESSPAYALARWRATAGDEASAELGRLAELTCAGGGRLVYAPRWDQDFPLTPAAAPSLWFAIAAAEVAERQPAFIWTEPLSAPASGSGTRP